MSERSGAALPATGIVLAGLILILLASHVSAEATSSPTAVIENFTVPPQVPAPGDTGVLTVMAKNIPNAATRQDSAVIINGSLQQS